MYTRLPAAERPLLARALETVPERRFASCVELMEALEGIGYKDYLTFEYFHPFAHYPEALIYHTSDALDRILGRKFV